MQALYDQLVTGVTVIAESVPGGTVERRDGVVLTVAGRGPQDFNTAWVVAPPRDLDGTLAWAVGQLRASGCPWWVQVPDSLGLDLGPLLVGLGLEVRGRVPAMALPDGPDSPPAAPDGLRIRRVEGPEEMHGFRRAADRGFGAPETSSDPATWALTDTLLDDDRVAMFTAYAEGFAEPVGTAVAVTADGTTGVYAITTLPEHRRRGYGTALTWAAVEAGREAGATLAVLQASEMGAPVYARMGFEVLTWYVRLGAAGPPA